MTQRWLRTARWPEQAEAAPARGAGAAPYRGGDAMDVTLKGPFIALADQKETIAARGDTLGELLEAVAQAEPGLGRRMFTAQGAIAPELDVRVNGVDARLLGGVKAALLPQDSVVLAPYPLEPMTPRQAERYARQMILGEIGAAGQARLTAARVAVIGAGGLGAPAATYLAAAGVGHLVIIDGDRVERSNLQRQPLHRDEDVGRPKAESAARSLRAINPDIEVIAVEEFLAADNALELLRGCDVIVNGSDNFPTRYLVSDAAVLLGRPLVDASILRFEGRLSVYLPRQGCYRCLFPEPPPPGSVPSCAEAGVIGALGGQMGSLQALETIKLITGAGESLGGRLLVYDALMGEERRFRLRRDPHCAACGDHPTLTELVDYEAFCGVEAPREAQEGLGIPVPEALALREDPRVQWLDVRAQGAVDRPTIPGALRLPLEELGSGEALDGARPVVVFCEIGRRSLLAAERLMRHGIDARSLEGGIVAWTAAGLDLTC